MTRRFVGAIPRAKPLLIPAKYLIICASVLSARLPALRDCRTKVWTPVWTTVALPTRRSLEMLNFQSGGDAVKFTK